jgi:hypothetical protein
MSKAADDQCSVGTGGATDETTATPGYVDCREIAPLELDDGADLARLARFAAIAGLAQGGFDVQVYVHGLLLTGL